MSLLYIGGFPPPYGGVTTKNENLYIAISDSIKIKNIDFNKIKRKNIIEAIRFCIALINRKNRFVVGVAGRKTRKRLCKLLYYINKKSMKESVIFLMGGTVANDIANDLEYQKYVSQYKRVYAETMSMVSTLKNVGLMNAEYYPNCRFKPKIDIVVEPAKNNNLNCVFFSSICIEKGADIVLNIAKKLPNMNFSFYGPVDEKYKNDFMNDVNSLQNVVYNGVFTGTKDEVYQELSKYDVLLFPTRYDIEGVPGILVESKIAGITCIVSDKSYNSEIIKDDVEGLVVKNNSVEEYVNLLNDITINSDKLLSLKKNNFNSSELYYIENYIDQIIKILIS